MLAAKKDFTIEQGASFIRIIQWNDPNGNPVDLTNGSATLRAKYTRDHDTAIFTWTSGNEITLGGADGSIIINVAAADLAAFDFGRAFYELVVTLGSNTYRLLEGNLILSKVI